MIKNLLGESRQELAGVESVSLLKLFTLNRQLLKLVSYLLDVAEQFFWTFIRIGHRDCYGALYESGCLVHVRKAADDLARKACRARGTLLRPGIQLNMKRFAIRSIHKRNFGCGPDKDFTAVGTLIGIARRPKDNFRAVHQLCPLFKHKPARLRWEAWQEAARGEGVDALELCGSLKQFGKLISSLFDLRKYRCQIFRSAPGKYHQDEVLRPNSIVRVGKITRDLPFVKSALQSWTRVWTRQQNEMESFRVGAIDGWTSQTGRLENLPAVSALNGISPQLNYPPTPIAPKTLPMTSGTLRGKPWLKLAIAHRINRAKFLVGLNKLRNKVSYILDRWLRTLDVDHKVFPVRAKLIMHVRKAAYLLISKKSARSTWTPTRPRKQIQVKVFSVRPVDKWRLLSSNKRFPSVAALIHVSLHGEFRSLLRRIGISFRRELLCSMAQALERGPLVLVGLHGFPLEVAGGGQPAFAQELRQPLRSEFASAISLPEIEVGSVSQIRQGVRNFHACRFSRKSGPNGGRHSARGGSGRLSARLLHTVSVGLIKTE